MEEIKLSGTVFSGGGEGKKFVALPWVKRQTQKKLGYIPYSGTLNLKLSRESVKRKKLLEKGRYINVYPAEGYCRGVLIEASIETMDCAIVMPEMAGYPKNVLEIIAPVNLREKLQLKDGSEVAVTVNL